MSDAAAGTMRIGFVHTAPALTPTFEDLLAEYSWSHASDGAARADGVEAADRADRADSADSADRADAGDTAETAGSVSHGPAEALHVVDAWLLRTALATGVDARVHERVRAHVRHLAALGADAVLITCSSIGETVSSAADEVSIPVLRVDAAMAEQARDLASAGVYHRIAALATFTSTLGPTQRLLEAVAGAGIEVTADVVAGAADAKAAGDAAGHDAAILAAAQRVATRADVIVIAQASMAAAVAGADLTVPALTSPRGGVQAVLAAARRVHPTLIHS
ncbi:aspartate/glutamate racemase family protein [Ruania halotolerans]|uniref:aspartate/glutamate racemase family protein n=1 Tax=Ruania halotolerans TaxID=2897773 RepID=UPI001E30A51E|nr:aspartate/glutamate racemase family protein [Ruania halotolerans]UFU08164.1 aspartate/glutamate racemase family protein [Ruania halotolerans]